MRTRLTIALVTLVTSAFSMDALAVAEFGRTQGQFAVSPVGSAQYAIAIWTPPDIRGIQPNLTLTYDSHLSYGLMGPGWTLNGLSTIARCNPTYAQDGAPAPITLTTADGLCLDGNRLRTTGTGVYQTEIANFSQVTASGTTGNGPSYFTVQGKDGLTYEYGNTTDSKILPSGSSTPYIWALDKVTDRSGNHMTLTYYQTDGAYVPLSIQYTAPNGSTTFPYQVNFGYTTKSATDTISKFIAGSQIQQTEQLSTITVTSSGATVREYKLLYTTSTTTLRATLTSIQECGGSAGTDCLAATSVAYQSGAAGVASPVTASGSGATNGTVYSVDIDGDGRKDLVYAVTSGSNYQWWVQLATATGYGAPINTGAVTTGTTDFLVDNFAGTLGAQILAPVGPAGSQVWYSYTLTGNTFTATSTRISVIASNTYVSADVDGDGLPDLVNLSLGSGQGTVNVGIQLNKGGSSISFVTAPVIQTISALGGIPITIAQVYGNNQFENSSLKKMDFDGDGRDDLLLIAKWTAGNEPRFTYLPLLSRGTNPPVVGTSLGSEGTIINVEIANWNDDACTDLIVGGGILLSPCNGSSPVVIDVPTYMPSLALDWDGDGRTDVLANVGGTWQVYRSEGDTIAPAVSTGISVSSGTWIITDKNGDGLDDLVLANSAASNALYYGLHSGAGIKPDLASSFNDGYGNSVDPTYVSIVQSDYTAYAYASPVYPYMNFLVPLYVVNKATFSDPSNAPNGTYYQTYSYSGAWTNLQGRGFSNFLSLQTFDSRSGLWETVARSNNFPWQNLLAGVEVSQDQANTKPISSWFINDETFITLDGTTNNERYFPYYGTKTTLNYELGGSENTVLISTTNTNYAFDNYGNATTVATTVADNDPQSPYSGGTWTSNTVNTITPDTSTWCINAPTETTVTNSSTAPGGSAITRTVTYTPDYTNCRETQKITEPNSAIYKVVEVYGYDSFGNLHTDTVTGIGMTPRVTTVTWNSAGQFPQTIQNPLGQSITLGFDPKTGMKTSQTDPNYTSSNPLVTTWTYDDFGRPISELRPDGTSTTWAYSSCVTNGCVNSNNKMTLTRTVLNVGSTTQSVSNIYLDSLDRPLVAGTTMLNGAYDRNEVQYDSLGRVHLQGAPCTFVSCTNYWTTNTYDGLNRLTQSQRPISSTNGNLQTTTIQYAGRSTTVTDPQGKNTIRVNLVTGSLARTQDNNGYYINLNYDAFGSLLSVNDSLSNTLNTMAYDYGIRAFQRSSNDADLGARHNTYNALGELTTYSDAKGQNFSVIYDVLSRPTSRTEPDLTTTWTWGSSATAFNVGKLQSVAAASTAGTYSEVYGYDSKTRPSTETVTIPGDAVYTYTKTYNATTGLLDTLQYPVSTSGYQFKLQYTYLNGILQQVSDATTGTHYWTANTANPRGQLTQETFGNGVVVNRALDAVTGWVSSIQAGVGGGATLQNNSYLFDEMGNLTQRQDNNLGLTENVYPDNLYRLDHTVGDSNTQMTYDGMGRILTWAAYGKATVTNNFTTQQPGCTYYANSQLHAVRSSTAASEPAQSFCYDANGNTTTISASGVTLGSMDWTSFNQPSYIASGTTSGYLYYNGNHQRYKQAATYAGSPETTVYVGGLLEKVSNSSGTTYRHYIPGGNNLIVYNRSSTGVNAAYYITKDHLGSSAAITDQTGALVVKEMFGAWGYNENTAAQQATIATISRHEYTGQEQIDNTGILLTNMNGRIYSPIGSMFLSPDPYVMDPGNTQNFNRYSYVNNNPLTLIDPSGFDDTLPDYTVICCSSSGSGSIIGDIVSFFAGLFSGGGPKLSANQRLAEAHGINLSDRLPASITAGFGESFIDNPVVQAAAAGTVGVDFNQYELNVGPAAPDPGTSQLDGITVTGHTFYGTNLSPLFVGIGRYDPLHAGVQTVQFGIKGALALSGVTSLYNLASGVFTVEAAATDMVTVTHFTSVEGALAIGDGGTLNAGSFVTTSDLSGLSASEVESALEIDAGKGAFSTSFQTPASNLGPAFNGPFTSGGAPQFQLINPTPVTTFIPTP